MISGAKFRENKARAASSQNFVSGVLNPEKASQSGSTLQQQPMLQAGQLLQGTGGSEQRPRMVGSSSANEGMARSKLQPVLPGDGSAGGQRPPVAAIEALDSFSYAQFGWEIVHHVFMPFFTAYWLVSGKNPAAANNRRFAFRDLFCLRLSAPMAEWVLFFFMFMTCQLQDTRLSTAFGFNATAAADGGTSGGSSSSPSSPFERGGFAHTTGYAGYSTSTVFQQLCGPSTSRSPNDMFFPNASTCCSSAWGAGECERLTAIVAGVFHKAVLPRCELYLVMALCIVKQVVIAIK